MPTRPKVVVAMSGGVDSAVAAALLQRQGYDCIGVFMRLGSGGGAEAAAPAELVACAPGGGGAGKTSLPVLRDGAVRTAEAGETPALRTGVPPAAQGHHQGCCSLNDAADARYVAGLLDIPFYALNFQSDFGQIIDYFVREYNAGRTPNPCVRCNEYLKFGKLAHYARAIGAEFVATGHYARMRTVAGAVQLLRGRDLSKDQSYVLFGVPLAQLAHMLLPLGDLDKTHVRQLAAEFGLPVFNKPDSQEICFVPDNDYARLVRAQTPAAFRPGKFISVDGQVLGEHQGHQHFTIGQRRGVGLALGKPAYVTAIDPVANTVMIGEVAALQHRGLIAHEVNWLAGVGTGEGKVARGEERRVMAKVRYNSPPALGWAQLDGPDTLRVRFDEPILAITPGQAVVCFDLPEADGSQRLLGGGWIDEVTA